MDYEKKYKDALERARTSFSYPDYPGFMRVDVIFPELQESEGERIRKGLIKALSSIGKRNWGGIDVFESISWLEKQGESYTKKDIDDAYMKGICVAKHELEKQGTPEKLSEEEQNSFAKGVLSNCALSFINYLDAHSYEGKMCVSNGECEDIDYAFHNAMWDRLHRYYCKYIEKQGEQKPIMNVPTREVILSIWDLGNEWKELTNGSISTEYGTQLDYIQKHWYESEYYLREKQGEQKPVLDFKASNWYVSKVDGKIHDMTYNSTDKVEPKFKIGDVLCDKSCTTLNKNSQPNIKILDIRNDMYICNNCSFPISQQDEYELVTKKIEPQSAWNDEDDYNLQCMIAKVTSDIQKGNVGRNNELIDWLKSLKDRATWKPSEEQIHAFIQVYVWYSNNFAPSAALTSLYNDLKKL